MIGSTPPSEALVLSLVAEGLPYTPSVSVTTTHLEATLPEIGVVAVASTGAAIIAASMISLFFII
jgi:hypothetical protein